MRTTILKIGKLHLWASGSSREPYANLWFDSPGRKNGVGTVIGYKGLSIFPFIRHYMCYTYESCNPHRNLFFGNGFIRYEGAGRIKQTEPNKGRLRQRHLSIGVSNTTPRWLQWYLQQKYEYYHWSMYVMYHPDTIIDERTGAILSAPAKPLFPVFILQMLVRTIKQGVCKHEYEVDEDGDCENGPSGSYYCPKCGKGGNY